MHANERKVTELVGQQIGAHALGDLETTLTDINFISAKCAAGLVVDLQLDYLDAIPALPEVQAELEEEARRQSEAARWTKEIIDYARQSSGRRDRLARGETVKRIQPDPALADVLGVFWSDERIEQEAERRRTNPTRLDRLRAFQGFVQQEAHSLLKFGTRPEFVVQQSFNHAPRGTVHEAAAQALPAVEAPLLLRRWLASVL